MKGNGTLYLLDPGNVLFESQVINFTDALLAHGYTPVDDPLRYRTASGGGARIVDKYSKTEKTHSGIETKKETKNRGSAVPLHVKGYPLKLDALLS